MEVTFESSLWGMLNSRIGQNHNISSLEKKAMYYFALEVDNNILIKNDTLALVVGCVQVIPKSISPSNWNHHKIPILGWECAMVTWAHVIREYVFRGPHWTYANLYFKKMAITMSSFSLNKVKSKFTMDAKCS